MGDSGAERVGKVTTPPLDHARQWQVREGTDAHAYAARNPNPCEEHASVRASPLDLGFIA
jgi:hypothetical protein